MKNWYNSFLLTSVLSAISVFTSYAVQSRANGSVERCSYLDPIAVDILAFGVGVFLVVEGVAQMWVNKNQLLAVQWSRSVRVAIGFAILTLHTMQFLHK